MNAYQSICPKSSCESIVVLVISNCHKKTTTKFNSALWQKKEIIPITTCSTILATSTEGRFSKQCNGIVCNPSEVTLVLRSYHHADIIIELLA